MTDAAVSNFPEELDYNESEVGQRDRKQIKDGVYKAVFKNAVRNAFKSGTMYIEGKWFLLDEEGNVTKFGVRDRIMMPFSNPLKPDHKLSSDAVGFFIRKIRGYLRSFGDEGPKQADGTRIGVEAYDTPRKQGKEKDAPYVDSEGNILSPEAVKVAFNQAEKVVRDRCKELWKDVSDLENVTAYIVVGRQVQKDKDTGEKKVTEWPEVKWTQSELKADQTLTTSDFLG